MLHHVKKVAVAAVAIAALTVGGSAIAGAATSHATATTTPSTSSPPAFSGPAHGTAAHEDAEKPVTGAAAAKAQAAAVKIVGSGTAGAVTTDLPGTGYEVTVTKADGSTVEVHLDSSFAAVQGPGCQSGSPGGQGA